jgi:hypothetical protein
MKQRKNKRKNKDNVNWPKVISLSAAGQYISSQLLEELKKLKQK